jgi:glucose/arabinose dehydrogenase
MRPVLFGSLLLVVACSGGNGETVSPTPTPAANTAPAFSSAAAPSVVENALLAYQATATDAESNPVTFSISGGDDAARFTITADGKLSFVTLPNFDLPADSDANNVYKIQLRASDGAAASTLDLAITVINSTEGIRVRRVASGLSEPTFITPVPGDATRILVAGRRGTIYYVNTATGAVTVAFTIGNVGDILEAQGLLGIAARPDFATSGVVFAHVTAPDNSVEIREYTIGSPTYRTVLRTPRSSGTTNGGWIAFGPDGYLYDAIGDGRTAAGDGGAQDPNSRLGKIVRIKIDTTPGSVTPFAPAPGNPFIGGGGDPYVFALGLHNPTASFDSSRLIITDPGLDGTEEIDIAGIGQPGLNFGWPYYQGTKVIEASGNPPAGLTGPVSQYVHALSRETGSFIIGGFVYRGNVPSLNGGYLFADRSRTNLNRVLFIPSSATAALTPQSVYPETGFEDRSRDFQPDVGDLLTITGFGIDSANNVYVFRGGSIYVIETDPNFHP